ncbi:PAS domain-containing protein, partial [Thiohalocapsa marina]|uniref:PAS domain-containing protein n=1 Tax=Thiohalocapsa marina TaxID=424902 RepID=UPI0036DB250C
MHTPTSDLSLTADSERERLQAELAGLRQALDTLGAYVYVKDLDGRYTYANRLVCELFGATPEEVIGRDDAEFFDLDLSDQLKAVDRQVLETGQTLEREEINILKETGETRTYWSIKAPLRDTQGRIVGLWGISTDISDRLTTEAKLAEYRQLIDTVLDNVDAYIYMKDRDGRYLFVNPKVAQLYRRTEAEILGRTDAELFPAAVADEFRRLDERVFASGQRRASGEQMLDEDGQLHHFWSVKLPLQRPGQADCLIGFSTDITEVAEAQAAMARSEARFRTLFEASSEAIA